MLTSDQIVYATPVWTIYACNDEETGLTDYYEICKNNIVTLTSEQVEKRLSTVFLSPFDIERMGILGLHPGGSR